jgi:hypothetical protein
MASKMGRRLVWAVLGTVATRMARRATRQALHNDWGNPRLPHRVRRERGLATALAWAVGTGAAMALADVLTEQGRTAARVRTPEPRATT